MVGPHNNWGMLSCRQGSQVDDSADYEGQSKRSNCQQFYRPIACLPVTWKLAIGLISEDLNDFLLVSRVLPEEQEIYRKGSSGHKGQLPIDKMIGRLQWRESIRGKHRKWYPTHSKNVNSRLHV